MKRDGSNNSFWQTIDGQNFPTDFSDLEFDTIIVGAGITGVTLAKELQDTGFKCLLLDKENPGFGTTGGTTAHINNFYDAHTFSPSTIGCKNYAKQYSSFQPAFYKSYPD
ncbi:FAD-dependent oxidoreductase [Sphingobacterium puteale]|uniref:FAD-dependent oxidoreductase n=1 Tax=Sphingobacterium puteale TaxID=2420510 RepID=A0A420VTJ0_9SPHI|nr:FAD-dependent oxidoreductase [Sphingobacterium puteale]RKO69661.1 FAD-dependent oxidoreductase [Sphingobacterium puteale]